MAKKQTRRSISMNQFNYGTVQQTAAVRGMTVAGLVEFALGAMGVPVVVHPQQAPELVGASVAGRAKRTGTPRRRSISINRRNYEAAKKAAADRGMPIAGLVDFALVALGVPVVAHRRQAPEFA